MTPTTEKHAGIRSRLEACLIDGDLFTDGKSRAFFSADLFDRGELCAAAVAPTSTSEVQRLVETCTQLGYAVIPRGGGLTYVQGYTPNHEKSVVFDMRRMNSILKISQENMYIQVEAGVTWKQINDALCPLGLRLPFLGTFSGAGATVGGGLSNGALFFGTARYGTAAELVLGIEAVTVSGRRLLTGQMSVCNSREPGYRTFGPDLTGLLVHDSGSLAVKTAATLRIIRQPEHSGFASFGFATHTSAIAALSEIARCDIAEEAYVLDPTRTRDAVAGGNMAHDMRTLINVMRAESHLLRGLKAGFKLAVRGRRFADTPLHSLHMTCSARCTAGLKEDLARCSKIAHRFNGTPFPDSIPRAARANLFPPLEGIVGPAGERWVALNAKVNHSEAIELYETAEAILEKYRDEMEENSIQVSRLLTVLSNHCFSYEPVLHWKDSWLPMHRETPRVASGDLQEPPDNPKTRSVAHRVRSELIELFYQMGAASNQIGRTYPYLSALHPDTATLIKQLKNALDPQGLMNPGVLELSPTPPAKGPTHMRPMDASWSDG